MKEKGNQGRNRRKIFFQLCFPDAQEVVLMGDFNQWNPRKHPMKRNGDGVWGKSVLLSPGTYEYKFFVDGEWQNDPENPLLCPNSFGSKNNFIII
jgi:1,4-alpha-glucan branching enzyme